MWSELLHPRDRLGRFADKLAKMKDGETKRVGGVRVRKRGGKFVDEDGHEIGDKPERAARRIDAHAGPPPVDSPSARRVGRWTPRAHAAMRAHDERDTLLAPPPLQERNWARWPRGTPISGRVGGGRFRPKSGGDALGGLFARTDGPVGSTGNTLSPSSQPRRSAQDVPEVDQSTRRAAPLDEKEVELLEREWARLGIEAQLYAPEQLQSSPRLRRAAERQRLIQKRLHYGRLFSQPPDKTPSQLDTRDVVVIGAGPAGMSAALHGSYEGLDVLVLEGSERVGGQSARSARIENYLGMELGMAGASIAEKGRRQAERYGAQIETNARVRSLRKAPDGDLIVELEDGRQVKAHTAVLASGKAFGPMNAPGLDGENVVYGDSAGVASKTQVGDPVVLVGGGNSAAQAALDLAARGRKVTVLVRKTMAAKTSPGLLKQLQAERRVKVMEGAEIESADKAGDRVIGVTLKDGRKLPARGVGLYLGQKPVAGISDELEVDERGFVRTGQNGRHLLETNLPGVFATGDTRAGEDQGALARVQVAAGEGAVAIGQITKRIEKREKKGGHRHGSDADVRNLRRQAA